MQLTLVREVFNKDWTQGRLTVDGEFLCYTLEDCDRFLENGGTKAFGITAIPRGNYQVKLTNSPRFKKLLPELMDVPQFTAIRIHSGNDKDDTEGCILVGLDRTESGQVLRSKLAMDALMKVLQEADNGIWLEVK